MSNNAALEKKICQSCGEPLTGRKQKKFCSRACFGLSIRGTGDSYIRIRLEDGSRVYFHRWVFEQTVRPLKPDEIVHHRDENKFNNEPDNLEALSGHAAHLHAHNYWRHRRTNRETTIDAEYAW